MSEHEIPSSGILIGKRAYGGPVCVIDDRTGSVPALAFGRAQGGALISADHLSFSVAIHKLFRGAKTAGIQKRFLKLALNAHCSAEDVLGFCQLFIEQAEVEFYQVINEVARENSFDLNVGSIYSLRDEICLWKLISSLLQIKNLDSSLNVEKFKIAEKELFSQWLRFCLRLDARITAIASNSEIENIRLSYLAGEIKSPTNKALDLKMFRLATILSHGAEKISGMREKVDSQLTSWLQNGMLDFISPEVCFLYASLAGTPIKPDQWWLCNLAWKVFKSSEGSSFSYIWNQYEAELASLACINTVQRNPVFWILKCYMIKDLSVSKSIQDEIVQKALISLESQATGQLSFFSLWKLSLIWESMFSCSSELSFLKEWIPRITMDLVGQLCRLELHSYVGSIVSEISKYLIDNPATCFDPQSIMRYLETEANQSMDVDETSSSFSETS